MAPIPITRAEYAAKFGGEVANTISAPIPITRAEYAARFSKPEVATGYQPEGTLTDTLLNLGGAANRAADMGTFGLTTKLGSGISALLSKATGDDRSLGELYDVARAENEASMENLPVAAKVLSSGVGLAGGSGVNLLKTVGLANKIDKVSKVGRLGVEGALQSGLSAYGHDQEVLPAMGVGGAVSAGISSLPYVGRGVGSVAKAIKNEISPNLSAQAEEATNAIVDQFGLDRSGIVSKLLKTKVDPSYAPLMRPAEKIQDPAYATLTKVLEKRNPEASTIGTALDAARIEKRLLDFISPQGQIVSKETAGRVLREGLAENANTANEGVKKLYDKALGGKGVVPIFPAKMSVSDAILKEAEYGLDASKNVLSLVDNFKQLPNTAPLSVVNEYRKRAGSMLGAIKGSLNKTPQDITDLKVLTNMFGALDDVEKAAIGGKAKGITATEATALAKGRESYIAKEKLFGKDATGAILRKGSFDDYKLEASKVLNKAGSSPESARQVLLGIKNTPNTKEVWQSSIMEQLKPRSGIFTPKTFANQWEKIKPIANEVLSSNQKQAIEKVKNDLLSRANFDSIASRASKGQSVTAQDTGAAELIKKTIMTSLGGKTGILGGIFSNIGAKRAQKVEALIDQNLVNLAFDEDYAKVFLSKTPSVKQINAVANEVINKSGVLSARVLAGLQEDEPEAEPTTALQQIKKQVEGVKVKAEDNKSILMQEMSAAGITDPVEANQFLAQMEHESAGFKKLKEVGSGTKYEGRKDLGNTQKGDGEKFKGRGFIQLTGRSNYEKYGKKIGVDLVKNPELAEDPKVAAKIAIAYWSDRVKPKITDFNDVKAVTKIINGGFNGLSDREKRFSKYSKESKTLVALLQEIANKGQG